MATISQRTLWRVHINGPTSSDSRRGASTIFPSRTQAAARLAELQAQGFDASVTSVAGPWRARVRRHGMAALTKTFKTRREAQAWATKAEADLLDGKGGSSMQALACTLGDLLHRHAQNIPVDSRKNHPVWYRCQSLARFPIASKQVAKLSASDFARFRDERLHQVKPTTVIKELDLFHLLLEGARELDIHLAHNFAGSDFVRRPKKHAGSSRTRRLELPAGQDRSERQRLLAALRRSAVITHDGRRVVRGSRLLLHFVRFLLATAMRRGEALKLRWSDLARDQSYVLLPAAITKNRHARIVPLTPRAQRVLKVVPRSGGRIFEELTENSVRLGFARARKAAGLTDFRMHDLRHEATSQFYELTNLRDAEIAEITGHRDLRMLQRYTHLRPESFVQRFRYSFERAPLPRVPDVSPRSADSMLPNPAMEELHG